jgi:CheY-like chemotaxis protein
MSILLSQDDAGNRELAVEVLRAEGWDVVAIMEPPTLDLVRRNGPGAIVLDGHDVGFLGQLRTSPAFAHTPVVLWTALALGPDAIAALEQQFRPLAVVQKPKMMPELPDAIRLLLAREGTDDGKAAG